MTNYEKETLNAYRSHARAFAYKKFHTAEWSWGRLVTWFEQKAVAAELKRHDWCSDDQLLDIPCGTGILGVLTHQFPFQITASDISKEMMALAKEEYPKDRLIKFTQADITATNFALNSYSCIISLGFLHRVPLDIKRATLKELYRLSSHLVILTCSFDTPFQRLKHFILSKLRRNHLPALCPITYQELAHECESVGFRVTRAYAVLPFLSAHNIIVLTK